MRQHITKNIQIAAFYDVGTVYASETPDFSGDLLAGAGLGIRYVTPVGPLRVDVATPLNRREITQQPAPTMEDPDPSIETVFEDAAIQIYIALGQPF